jgi:hypothetical protein
MLGFDGVFARVTIFRVVAATHMRASPAPAQMNPTIAHGDALGAPLAGRGHVLDRSQMCAFLVRFSHFTPIESRFAPACPIIANFARQR